MAGKHNARERLRNAALDFFIRHGVKGAPVPEIIKAAGAGAGSFYRHFSNKEDLAAEILEENWGILLERLVENFYPDKPVRLQVHEAFKIMAVSTRERPREFFFCEIFPHEDYISLTAAETRLKIRDLWTEIIDTVRREGYLRFGPKHLPTAIYWGAWLEMIRLGLEGKIKLSDDEIEWVESGCWRAVTR